MHVPREADLVEHSYQAVSSVFLIVYNIIKRNKPRTFFPEHMHPKTLMVGHRLPSDRGPMHVASCFPLRASSMVV